jgi:hypothetical protein
MGSMDGWVLLMELIRQRNKRAGAENTHRFLSIDKRTKSEGGRAIVHALIILGQGGRFHKNRIFDESSERWRF